MTLKEEILGGAVDLAEKSLRDESVQLENISQKDRDRLWDLADKMVIAMKQADEIKDWPSHVDRMTRTPEQIEKLLDEEEQGLESMICPDRCNYCTAMADQRFKEFKERMGIEKEVVNQ